MGQDAMIFVFWIIFTCENTEAQKNQTTVEAGVGFIRKDSWQTLT